MLYSGMLIGNIRKRYKISRRALGYGLVSNTALTYIENGERSVGKLLFEALYQRLGKYSGRFETFVDGDEYELLEMRWNIQDCIDEGKYSEAKKIVEEYKCKAVEKWDIQAIILLECELMFRTGAKPQQYMGKLLKGIQCTIPHFEIDKFEDYLYSTMEMMLIQQYVRCMELIGQEEEAVGLYKRILKYLEQDRYDRSERAMLYRYPGYLLVEYYIRKQSYEKAKPICMKVYDEVKKAQTITFFADIWQQSIVCREKCGEDMSKEKKYLDTLKSRNKEYGVRDIQDYFPRYVEDKAYSVNAVIRQRRKMLGMTQEDLAGEICDTSTISRLENNRYVLRGRLKTPLLQAVKMSGDTHIASVDTYDYTVFDELNKINDGINAGNPDAMEKILDGIVAKYELTSINSKQYIYSMREQIQVMKTGKSSEPEAELEDLLSKSLGDFKTQKLDNVILLENEMLLFEKLIKIYKRQKNIEESIRYLRQLENVYRCSYRNKCYGYVSVCEDLGDVLGEAGYIDEANDYVMRAVKGSIAIDFMPYIPYLAYGYVWNVINEKSNIDQADKAMCKKMAEWCYVTSNIYGDEKIKGKIEDMCMSIGVELDVI